MTPASLVLEFGSDVAAGAVAVVEFDPIRHTETSFTINVTRQIYFLVHLESGLDVEWLRPTIGSVQEIAPVRQIREERVSYSFDADAQYKDLKYYPADQPSSYFYGNTPVLSPVRGRRLAVANENNLPGIADIEYKVDFRAFCFNAPTGLAIRDGKTDYPVEIRIKIGATA